MRARLSPFWRAVAGLGFTQIIAWGCVYYPISVTGPEIARDLGLSLGTVFGLYSALLLSSACVAPAVGRLIDRSGGRPVLAAGCLVATLALALTAGANGVYTYAGASLLLGIAAAMTLYDAAFPALVEATGARGRRAITLVTFAGGFASTIFWPITAVLVAYAGWRATYVVYALVMLCVCLPANWLALPHPRPAAVDDAPTLAPVATDTGGPYLQGTLRARVLWLFAMTCAANQIVAAAFLIHIIDFSERLGIGAREAIGLGMLFGPAQVLGRIGEMLAGARFSAVATGRVATAFLPLGLLFVLPQSTTLPAAIVFVLALGLSNGLMTIARGTVALALFGPVGYGGTIGRITVPTLLARAAGPFLFAVLLENLGVRGTVLIGLAISACACIGMEFVASIERRVKQGATSAKPVSPDGSL